MSTVGQAAAPSPNRQPAKRPSAWRKTGAAYLDMLFSCFLGWITATAFQVREQWPFLAIGFLFFGIFVCRNLLKPTLGDYFMNIRYLVSSSNQVVADIRVVNNRLKLNGFLLFAGTVETTWAVIGLSAWTIVQNAASWGWEIEGPAVFLYYTGAGFLLFLCAAALLSGSRTARWAVPLTHAVLLGDFLLSADRWFRILPGKEILLPWYEKAAPLTRGSLEAFFLFFALWSFVLAAGVALSRKVLVQ